MTRTWSASPTMAWSVRVLVFVAPVAVGWGVLRALGPVLYRPQGWVGTAVWLVQALVLTSLVAMIVDRVARRALPLATLLGMSLTFPDQAPSRFTMALKAGTVSKLRAQLAEVERNGLGHNPQEAAERAVDLVTMLGRHERLTRGHTERVRAYADLIAVELGLPEPDRQLLAWGVLLHDIGKLTVPPEILNKAGRPTEQEWAILSAHPAEGARMIEPLVGWLGEWAKAAGEHHERWDGRGYPNKLAGAQISLAGRITAVADAYDVITSRRSYKAPMSVAAARKELVECAGSQFDPAIVRAMLQASVRRGHRMTGILSWLPELPGLGSVAQGVTAAPAAMATAAIAVAAPLTGIALTPAPPDDLAFIPSVTVATDGEVDDSGPADVGAIDGGLVDSDPVDSGPVDSVTADGGPVDSGPVDSVTVDGVTVDSGEPTSTTVGSGLPPATPESGPVVPLQPVEDAGATPSKMETPTSSKATTTTASTPNGASRAAETTVARAVTGETTATKPVETSAPGPVAVGGPVAKDDTGTQRSHQRKQYRVLDNDRAGDSPLDPATLTVVGPPAAGTAEPWKNTTIRYQGVDGYTGTVTVTYQICDVSGRCSQATLTIDVTRSDP